MMAVAVLLACKGFGSVLRRCCCEPRGDGIWRVLVVLDVMISAVNTKHCCCISLAVGSFGLKDSLLGFAACIPHHKSVVCLQRKREVGARYRPRNVLYCASLANPHTFITSSIVLERERERELQREKNRERKTEKRAGRERKRENLS